MVDSLNSFLPILVSGSSVVYFCRCFPLFISLFLPLHRSCNLLLHPGNYIWQSENWRIILVLFSLEISSSSLLCWLKGGGDYSDVSLGSHSQLTSAQPNRIQLPKEGPVSQFLSGFGLALQIPNSLWVPPFQVSGEGGRWGRWNDFFLFVGPAFTSVFFSQQIWGGWIKALLSWIVFQTLVHPTSLHPCWCSADLSPPREVLGPAVPLHPDPPGLTAHVRWAALSGNQFIKPFLSPLFLDIHIEGWFLHYPDFSLCSHGSSGLLHPKWKPKYLEWQLLFWTGRAFPMCKLSWRWALGRQPGTEACLLPGSWRWDPPDGLCLKAEFWVCSHALWTSLISPHLYHFRSLQEPASHVSLLRGFLWTPKSILPMPRKLERWGIHIPQRQSLGNDGGGWWINTPAPSPLGEITWRPHSTLSPSPPKSSQTSCPHWGLAGNTLSSAAFSSLSHSPTSWLACPGITF